ncbi:peroxisome assembly protein (Peroxin-2) [Cladochytrium tenue]|nr:peroxisome assembly protein (Peroxin-2) [Cladochytrium tenue]
MATTTAATSVPEAAPSSTSTPSANAQTPWPFRVIRVAQLDAAALDDELVRSLREQLHAVLSPLKIDIKDRFDPEISALLWFLTSSFAIYSKGASYGLDLQNLKYRDESKHRGRRCPSILTVEASAVDAPLRPSQALAHAGISVLTHWGFLRVKQFASRSSWDDRPSDDWRNKLWRWLLRLELAYQWLSFANFLVFLYNGRSFLHLRYLSLIYRAYVGLSEGFSLLAVPPQHD